ncbi:uncharacterized protein LY89DRAFT_738177 [Mollisia scopiformis]|uniref:Uncharacterized protein n=1 Tax=Mollisia scopiformis TaxID=149040 RepID=A0A194WXR8_MOLSC|nr:uncharacterized protein LY89DRAFT_738177 [Mollisia scopiformis]KUJ12387.1 hypothetical protein LY89DRAFT_738177 [Mollisia scopiformis]
MSDPSSNAPQRTDLVLPDVDVAQLKSLFPKNMFDQMQADYQRELEPSHDRNRLMPLYTERQRRMLEALKKGGIDALAKTIYLFAAIDHARLSPPDDATTSLREDRGRDNIDRPGVLEMAQKLIDDEEGDMQLLKLLHTSHKDVLEAIILGHVGFRWKNNPEYLAYKIRGPVLPDSAAGEVLTTAIDMDMATIDRMKDRDEVEKRCRSGERVLSFARVDRWIDMLSHRIDDELDPVGDDRQVQAPLYVGCSQHIGSQLMSHDPLLGMGSSAVGLRFLFSCIMASGIKLEIIRLPIWKIWDSAQLPIKKIGLTYLAGSMVFDGGINSIAPGGTYMDDDPLKFELTTYQIFGQNDWTYQNLKESKERRIRMHEALDLFEETRANPNLIKDNLEDLSKEFNQFINYCETVKFGLSSNEQAMRRRLKEMEEERDELLETLADQQLQLKFHKGFNDTLRENGFGDLV